METTTRDLTPRNESTNKVQRKEHVHTFLPRLDVYESPEAYRIAVELPGVNERDVDITLEQGLLRIQGVAGRIGYDGYTLQYAEYEPGAFRRELRVGDGIDNEKIAAQMKDGILYIVLPKRETLKARKINVRVA